MSKCFLVSAPYPIHSQNSDYVTVARYYEAILVYTVDLVAVSSEIFYLHYKCTRSPTQNHQQVFSQSCRSSTSKAFVSSSTDDLRLSLRNWKECRLLTRYVFKPTRRTNTRQLITMRLRVYRI